MRKIHANVTNVSYAEVRLYKNCDGAQVTNSSQKEKLRFAVKAKNAA
jgi:hypothetical protein